MQRIPIIVTGLLAMLCLSGVAATTAAANEGFFVTHGGVELKLKGVTATSEATKIESSGGTIECKKDEGKGEALSKEEGTIKLLFDECAKTSTKEPCTSPGNTEGSITLLVVFHTRVPNQKGETVFILTWVLNAEKTEATEAKPVEFKCGSTTVKLYGGFNVKVPTKEEKTTFALTSEASKEGHENTPSEYETETKEKVKVAVHINTGEGWKTAAVVGTEHLTFEEAIRFEP